MEKIINLLKDKYPKLSFKKGDSFSWAPHDNKIIYPEQADESRAIWSLLHETGHALLKHSAYQMDFELLRLEANAWQKAKEIAKNIGVAIDEDHIQDCLDTYRDWLYRRSICPSCNITGLQDGRSFYKCHNCRTRWKVSSSRFCRPYRHAKSIKKSPALL